MSGFAIAQAGIFVVAAGLALATQRRRGPLTGAHAAIAVMVGALAVGTSSHVENIARSGWQPRPEEPLAFNLFWTSLVALDPLAALLLLARPRAGLALTLGIMAADLAVNLSAFGAVLLTPAGWFLWWQLGFGLFVAAAAPLCWRAVGRAT